MSAYVWVDPANPRTKYMTSIANDPIPTSLGYVLTTTSDGSAQIVDGEHDSDEKVFTGGLASGGYPAYAPDGYVVDPRYPNGRLS